MSKGPLENGGLCKCRISWDFPFPNELGRCPEAGT